MLKHEKIKNVIDLAVAQVWYDTTIEPTLTWNNTQPDTTQLRNTIADRATLEALRPTDRHRQEVLRLEIRKHDERIRTIKARL